MMKKDEPIESGDLKLDDTSWRPFRLRSIVEILAIFVTLFLMVAESPPDVNESYYLTKAKHFWQADWCEGDLFLDSSSPHWFFFFSAGWVTRFFSLTVSAWILRIVSWILFAVFWHRLSTRLVPNGAISIFSAAAMVLLVRYFHLAGEWIIGGTEGKSLAYVALIAALSFIVDRQWNRAWISLGIASLFHVLVGGWAIVCVLAVAGFSGKIFSSWREHWSGVVVAAALTLIAAVPALFFSSATEPEVNQQAYSIQVHGRLAHHLDFMSFEKSRVTLFFLALVAWVGLACSGVLGAKFRLINQFCLASFLLALVGGVLSFLAIPEHRGVAGWGKLQPLATSLLRFYWFRLADTALAIGLSLALFGGIQAWRNKVSWQRKLVMATVMVVVLTGAVADFLHRQTEIRPPADAAALPQPPPQVSDPTRWSREHHRNWMRVCRWIHDNTPPEAIFLTPRSQQTFNWYAGRAQVVCYKDMPQNPDGVLEWSKRSEIFLADPYYWRCQNRNEMLERIREFKIDFWLVRQGTPCLADAFPERFQQVYPTEVGQRVSYVVYRVRAEDQSQPSDHPSE